MGIFGSSRPDVAKFAEEKDIISLIGVLGHKNPEVRRDAKEALIGMGAAADTVLHGEVADLNRTKQMLEVDHVSRPIP